MSTLLTASILLLLLWPAYAILLHYSDRYALNRFLLILAMVAVVALPFVSLESPAPVITQSLQGTIEYVEQTAYESVTIVPEDDAVYISSDPAIPAALVERAAVNVQTSTLVYLGGAGLMLLLLGGRMLFLLSLHLRSRPDKDGGYQLLHPGASPGQAFTFGSTVYFSQDVPEDSDFAHILNHEQIHARQLHTVDIMLTEVFLCVFWFHPAAWWLRTQMRANLEYLVDKAVVNQGADRRSYQLALVRQSVAFQGLALALPFSEPSLKSRISRLTGLPGYRAIGLLAAVALTFWMGVAMLVVNGDATDLTKTIGTPNEVFVTAPNLSELQAEHTQSDVSGIESFELYFRRLPTPYEFAQIRDILGVLDNTHFSIYRPCDAEEGEYSLELSHWLNVEAQMSFYLREEELMDDHQFFKLKPNGMGGNIPLVPHVSAGYFNPVFGETVLDKGDVTISYIVEGNPIELEEWLGRLPEKQATGDKIHLIDYRDDIVNEEIAVFINGERQILESSPPNSISVYGMDADRAEVKVNGRPVPTWSQSTFANWREVEAENGMPLVPASARMNCLLGMPGNRFGLTRNVRSGHSGSSRVWFDRMELPEGREITYYLNDEISTAAEVLDREFKLVDVQLGYDCNDPNGLVIVQAIDDLY